MLPRRKLKISGAGWRIFAGRGSVLGWAAAEDALAACRRWTNQYGNRQRPAPHWRRASPFICAPYLAIDTKIKSLRSFGRRTSDLLCDSPADWLFLQEHVFVLRVA